ncbi:hypothetical protein [Microbispora sp. NPDC046933]|uniref:hypothetical protein n=1 Tax=Microbispora sp. NPDC046933 TaxID=3155618 RepID=UPI00340CE959
MSGQVTSSKSGPAISPSKEDRSASMRDPLKGPARGSRRLMCDWRLKAVFWTIVGVSPALVVTVLVRHYFNVGLLSFTPAWSDEIEYWHQIATFRTVGFAGGVYGVDEGQAKLSFLHFGSHGPAFPMLLASISAIAGWRLFSGPLINMAVVGAAIFGFLALIRAGWVRATLTAALVLTFWPLMLYMTSTMQESVHQATAIVLAGMFFRLIRGGPDMSRALYVAGAVLLALACLLRPTWALLFVPLFFLRGATLSGRRLGWAVIKASPIIVAAFGLSAAVSTPYPNFVSQLTARAAISPPGAAHLLLLHLYHSAKALAVGSRLELALRAALLAIVVAGGVLNVVRHLRGDGADHREDLAAAAFHILNLVPLLVLLVAFYDVFDWRDYRVVAPYVLLSALVALARSERVVVVVVFVADLAVIGAVGPLFATLHHQHFVAVDPKTAALGDYITYKPAASPWENTVLVDHANFGPGLLNVPAGVGLTLYWRASEHSVKSRYLLMTREDVLKLGLDRLRLLTTTPLGALYERTE